MPAVDSPVLLQVLGAMLQLAPCPFWRLEAAIAPGPCLPHQSAASARQDSQPESVQAEEDGSQPEATTHTRKRRVSDNQVTPSSHSDSCGVKALHSDNKMFGANNIALLFDLVCHVCLV